MILVTGGTGLVGAHLLYHLTLNEDKIRAIYRSKNKLENVKKVFSFYTNDPTFFSKIEWIQADITEIPSMIPVFEGVKKSTIAPRLFRLIQKIIEKCEK